MGRFRASFEHQPTLKALAYLLAQERSHSNWKCRGNEVITIKLERLVNVGLGDTSGSK